MSQIFGAVGLTGGGDTALDGIRITDNSVVANDICLAVDTSGPTVSVYMFNAFEPPEEDSPNYIIPDYSTGTTPYTGDGYWQICDYQNVV